jgi:hypothetical protein
MTRYGILDVIEDAAALVAIAMFLATLAVWGIILC